MLRRRLLCGSRCALYLLVLQDLGTQQERLKVISGGITAHPFLLKIHLHVQERFLEKALTLTVSLPGVDKRFFFGVGAGGYSNLHITRSTQHKKLKLRKHGHSDTKRAVTYLKERSIIVIRSPCFRRSDCCRISPLMRVGFTELRLVKMSLQKTEEKEAHLLQFIVACSSHGFSFSLVP